MGVKLVVIEEVQKTVLAFSQGEQGQVKQAGEDYLLLGQKQGGQQMQEAETPLSEDAPYFQ